MKKPIFLKVFGGYVLLLVCFSGLLLLFSFGTVKRFHLRNLTHDLENIGRPLQVDILGYLDRGQTRELDAFLKQQGRIIKTRLTVIDVEGAVLADSEKEPELMESHRFRPELSEALQGRTGQAIRYSETVRRKMLYVALPLEKSGRVAGALRLSLYLEDIDVLLGALRLDIARVAAILLLASLLAAYAFSLNLTRPIRALTRVSRRVEAGDLSARVRMIRADEWMELARSFNDMAEKVQTSVADLRKRREELDRIIASMQEGLLVLDKSGKIILDNDGARRLIGQPALVSRFYWEVIRMTPFVDLVRRVQEEKGSQIAEVPLGEKSVLCRVSYLPAQDGAVVTLQDVTEVKNLARIKKDFVLNVSHELRTPLTAIRGYAETIEAEGGQEARAYAETILRHTDRLIRIVEDLLTLSVLEEKGAGADLEEVNLRELADSVVRIFEPKAKEKNLTLSLVSEPNLPSVTGDPLRLEQMLINLIDNAVKYTDKGGVRVSLLKREGGVAIEVADTGIGIPEEDQARVFERFYVVDKSRSRKLGGTGLGLSIVKHIAEAHGGRVELQSTPGGGTKMSVFLPGRPLGN